MPQDKFYLYRLYQENDNLEVWIVDGSYVRSSIDADFTEGGNGQAYPDFVPENHVWIDSETSVHEWQYILLHEITEWQLMKDEGLSYEQAHEKANQAELEFRQKQPHTVEIDPAQAEAGTHENDSKHLGGKQMPYTNVPESMWEKMDSCVEQVMAKQGGISKESAIAICHDQLVDGKSYLDALKARLIILRTDENAIEVKIGARNNSKDVARLKQIQALVTELLSDEQAEPEDKQDDADKSIDLVAFGDSIKSLSDSGEVGGYLVRWGNAQQKDLEGDYFTKNTYFGAHDGDGIDTFMNHCIPLAKGLEEFADWRGQPIKTNRDAIGLFAKTVLDLSDEYERIIFDLVKQGKLKWSSGTAAHLVKRMKDGQIKRWIIADASLTPIPAEWRESNKVYPIKSYREMFDTWSAEGLVKLAEATALEAAREIPDDLKHEAAMLKARAGASSSEDVLNVPPKRIT